MASQVNDVIYGVQLGTGANKSIASSAYGECTTASDVVAKVVDMTGFVLVKGVTITVKFTNSNTAENPTLNVNSKGAKPIMRYGTTNVGTTEYTSWKAGSIISLTYDGTNWIINDFLGIDENHIHSFTSEDKFINSVGVTYNNLLFSLSSKSLNVSRVVSDATVSTTEDYVTGYTGIGMELYTVSGDVVTFTTSSEDAIKALTISIVATQSGSGDPSPTNVRPITGWTGCNVDVSQGSVLRDKTVSLISVNSNDDKRYGIIIDTAGEYTFISRNTSSCYIYSRKINTDQSYGDINYIQAGLIHYKVTYTIASGESLIIFNSYATATAEQTASLLNKVYNIAAEYPISWQSTAGTVYGGTLNPLTGELNDTHTPLIDLGTPTWNKNANGQFYSSVLDIIGESDVNGQYILCSGYKGGNAYDKTVNKSICCAGSRLWVYDSDLTYSGAEFKAAMAGVKVTYKRATPITYQLTPVQVRSMLGVNNVWADCGAVTELKYTTTDESPSNKELEFGVRIDFDSSTSIRLKDAAGLSAGQDFDNYAPWNRRKCILEDGGHVLAYYGENGYTETGSLTQVITKNGTTYPIGTNVQVMVEQQPFWYKVVPISLTPNTDSGIGYHTKCAEYYISPSPKNGYKLHPAFYNSARPIYLSAYEGSYYDSALGRMYDDDSDTSTTINANDKLCSIGNDQKPISGLRKNLSKPNCELLASRRGNGWHLESIQVYMMNIFLSMVEFATFNSQNSIGAGVTSITDNSSYNCSSLTGSTSSLGNASGQASSTVNRIGSTTTTYTTSGKVSVSYRGQENPYGNIWKHIQSINFWGDGTMCGGQAYVNNTLSDFNESKKDGAYIATNITLANANGYAKYIGYSSDYDWLFLTSKVGDGASTSTIIGDYTYVTANLNAYRIALMGGTWAYGGNAGSLYWYGNHGVGYRNRNVGGRLMYIPSSS